MPTQTSSFPETLETSRPSSRRNLFVFLIVLVWAIVYLGTLVHPTLQDDADTVHAEAAREMAQSGDWVTLRINGGDGATGFRYLEKAPLMYWAVAASFKVFGVHDWSARLPIALGVLALLLVTYRLGRRIYSEEGGLYSALVLATGFGPFIFTRILIPDMAVALWLALGFDFFLTTLEQADAGQKPSTWLCWGIAATMALNVLTKGLIGLVFPVGTFVLFLLCTGRLRHLLKLRLVSSFLVFLVIAAPWHLLAGFRNPAQGNAKGFFWFYFVNEHFLRYLKKRYPADYDTVPIWLFWGLNLVWLMPWTAFIVQAFRQVPLRAREWRAGLSKQGQGTLLFAIWILWVLVFFSFSSRQEYYVIPGIPGLALLLGGWLARETTSPVDSRERRGGRIASAVLMAIGVLACAFAVMLAAQSKTPPLNYDIADLLKRNPTEYELSFGHFLDLTPQAMGAFKIPLLATGIALAVGTILNFLLRRGNRAFAANLVLAAMMVVILRAAQTGLEIFSPVLSSEKLARAVESHWTPGAVIETNGDYETASSVNFYTRRQIRMLNGRCNNIWYGSEFPDAPQVFDDDSSFEKLWQSPQTVFLLTAETALAKSAPSDKCPQDDRLPAYIKKDQACQVAKWGGKLLLTNELKLCPAPAPPRE
ncbi:MAG TPA: glycosyltransferase family 39 protein [Candidatus Angelobacter sp.]|nr:glycosyltransferase family 39 protein [Candidatus Angelobacter sp.]